MAASTGSRRPAAAPKATAPSTACGSRARLPPTALPVVTVEEPGAASSRRTTAAAVGLHPDLDAAAAAMVRPAGEIHPDPQTAEAYARMRPLFDELHATSAPLWDALDGLAAAAAARS